jgi:2-iminobutanoate/2-iminopropanoate deaminase
MKFIQTSQAPAAIGPYSQAISAQGLVFVSGQLGLNPITGELSSDLETQVLQALSNLEAILQAGGSDKNHVLKCTLYLRNMDNFALINSLYADFFGEHKPARATVEVSALPKNAQFEIEATALTFSETS